MYDLHIFGEFDVGISENQSLLNFLKNNTLFRDISAALFIPAVIAMILSFFLGFRKRYYFYILAGIGVVGIGFAMMRGLALFGLIFIPVVSAHVQPLFEKLTRYIDSHAPTANRYIQIGSAALLGFCVAILLTLNLFGKISPPRIFGLGATAYANSSAEFFNVNNIQGPVFNDADIGGYLMFHLYPRERVFVDNRFGDAYSPEFFNDEYLEILRSEEKWQWALSKYDFQSIFFDHFDKAPYARRFLGARINDPKWALVYIDQYAAILVRRDDENKELIDRFLITKETIESGIAFLTSSKMMDDQVAAANIFNLLGRPDLAMRQFKEVVTLWPYRADLFLALGKMELAFNTFEHDEQAVMYLERAQGGGLKTAEVYALLGYAYFKAGFPMQATLSLKKALRIEPERMDVAKLLAEIEKYQ